MVTDHARARAIRLAAIACGLATTLAACGGSDGERSGPSAAASARKATVSPPAQLVHAGKLTSGADFTYPPFDYIVGDEQRGLDVDLGKELAAAMGLELNMIDTRFASLIPGLNAKRFDTLLTSLFMTPERAEEVDFVPYFTTGHAFVVRKGDFAPREPEDVCGHSVAVLQGSAAEGLATDDIRDACGGALDVSSFPTDAEAFNQVLNGRAEVLLTDRVVAKYRIAELAASDLEISSSEILFPVPVGIAVRKGDADMKRAVSEALEILETDGMLPELLRRYGAEPVDPKLVAEVTR